MDYKKLKKKLHKDKKYKEPKPFVTIQNAMMTVY